MIFKSRNSYFMSLLFSKEGLLWEKFYDFIIQTHIQTMFYLYTHTHKLFIVWSVLKSFMVTKVKLLMILY